MSKETKIKFSLYKYGSCNANNTLKGGQITEEVNNYFMTCKQSVFKANGANTRKEFIRRKAKDAKKSRELNISKKQEASRRKFIVST